MAKIPRLPASDISSPVPTGPLPGLATDGGVAATNAFGNLADVGYKVTADMEQQEANKYRVAAERKQAIVNEVEASRVTGDYEMDVTDHFEKMKTEFSDTPDKVPEQLLEAGRLLLDRRIEAASNTQVGLETARDGNTRLMALVRQARAWSLERQTQKTTGDLEKLKNQTAVSAGNQPSVDGLAGHLATAKARLFPKFAMVYGNNAEKEWHDTSARAVESWARVNGDYNPLGVMAELRSPRGPLVDFLRPEQRDSLIARTERALEKRGETRQYEILGYAADKTNRLVNMLNTGDLDGAEGARTVIALQEENLNAQKAAAIDPNYTPEQRKAQVEILERQGEVLAAVDDIRMRTVKFDPARQAVNDIAAIKNVDTALKRFKGKAEQLPLIVEQMRNLTLARKSGELSPAGYAAAFGHVGLAYQKALSDEASNDGFLIFHDARETGNRMMNRLLDTRAKGVSEEKKSAAWVSYMDRFQQESKKGDVSKEMSERFARNAISTETGVDVRIKGD